MYTIHLANQQSTQSMQGWVLSSPKLVLEGQWTKPGLNRTKLDKTGQNYLNVSVIT